MIVLIPTLCFSLSSHHHKYSMQQIADAYKSKNKCTYPHTVLYVYTQPIQKECVLLMHNGKVVNAEGRSVK